MNAVTNAVSVNESVISQIDFVPLFGNALEYFKSEIKDAKNVFEFALENTEKSKALKLAKVYENARATLLYDKIINDGQHTIDSKDYYDVKNAVRNYAFTWIKSHPIEAAENKLKYLESLKPETLTQAEVLFYILQIEYHVKQISIYFYKNPNRIADLENTLALRKDKIIEAIVNLEASSAYHVVKDVRSLGQVELEVVLKDGLSRLHDAKLQAKTNLDKAHQMGPWGSCDAVAANVGFLKSCLLAVKFCGIEHDAEDLKRLVEKLNGDEDTGLKVIRGSRINGSELVVNDVIHLLNKKTKLTDKIVLGNIWRMQTHREWLSYYNNVDAMVQTMQDYAMNITLYNNDGSRYKEVQSFVKQYI